MNITSLLDIPALLLIHLALSSFGGVAWIVLLCGALMGGSWCSKSFPRYATGAGATSRHVDVLAAVLVSGAFAAGRASLWEFPYIDKLVDAYPIFNLEISALVWVGGAGLTATLALRGRLLAILLTPLLATLLFAVLLDEPRLDLFNMVSTGILSTLLVLPALLHWALVKWRC